MEPISLLLSHHGVKISTIQGLLLVVAPGLNSRNAAERKKTMFLIQIEISHHPGVGWEHSEEEGRYERYVDSLSLEEVINCVMRTKACERGKISIWQQRSKREGWFHVAEYDGDKWPFSRWLFTTYSEAE